MRSQHHTGGGQRQELTIALQHCGDALCTTVHHRPAGRRSLLHDLGNWSHPLAHSQERSGLPPWSWRLRRVCAERVRRLHGQWLLHSSVAAADTDPDANTNYLHAASCAVPAWNLGAYDLARREQQLWRPRVQPTRISAILR